MPRARLHDAATRFGGGEPTQYRLIRTQKYGYRQCDPRQEGGRQPRGWGLGGVRGGLGAGRCSGGGVGGLGEGRNRGGRGGGGGGGGAADEAVKAWGAGQAVLRGNGSSLTPPPAGVGGYI